MFTKNDPKHLNPNKHLNKILGFTNFAFFSMMAMEVMQEHLDQLRNKHVEENENTGDQSTNNNFPFVCIDDVFE